MERGMGNAHYLRIAGIAAAAALLVGAGTARADTSWNLYNGSACKQIVGSGTACVGDGSSHAGSGNVYQFTATDGTTQMTGAAYHSSSSSGSSTLGKSFLGIYTGSTYGLGVENLSSPEHAVDNNDGFDFVAFKFPSTFNNVSITLSPFGSSHDMDATIFFGTPAGALNGISDASGFTGKTIAQLLDTGNGFKSYEFDGSSTSSKRTVDLPDADQGMYLIVAASLTSYGLADYFKINAITGTPHSPPSTSVPEPSTLALLLVGALGVCGSRRFRQRAAA
jgi:hypothetical protein